MPTSSMSPSQTSELHREYSRWEQWDHIFMILIPYITLSIATVLSFFQTHQSWQQRGRVLILVLIAALWVFFWHSRAPRPHQQTLRMRLYFFGLLIISVLLMLQQPIFFVFMITGFFHGALLRPLGFMLLGVALTSILINTVNTGFPWKSSEAWIFFGAIIGIQIPAISFGILTSDRMSKLSEQRRQALIQLESSMQENAKLQAKLLTQAREAGILDERQRIAREIHDTLAQGLTGIITQLEAAQRHENYPPQRQHHLEKAHALARSSLVEARRSVHALQPEPLESIALAEALKTLCQQWAENQTIAVHYEVTGAAEELLPEIEATLFRVAQEALTNVSKHAQASRVGITLSYMDDVVLLDVRDDGIGFLPEHRADIDHTDGHGFGLRAMQQRLQRVAGNLIIESSKGQGVAISASVPALKRREGELII